MSTPAANERLFPPIGDLQQLLLATFADEAQQEVQTINARMLDLDKASGDEKPRLLEGLFRQAHSLKAAARAIGLRRLEAVAHELESLLGLIQDGAIDAGVDVFSQVYRELDALTGLVEAATAGVDADVCRTPSLPVSTLFATFSRMIRRARARALARRVHPPNDAFRFVQMS